MESVPQSLTFVMLRIHAAQCFSCRRQPKTKIGSPARVMVYREKEYLAREQDAPTAVLPNKHNRNLQKINNGT